MEAYGLRGDGLVCLTGTCIRELVTCSTVKRSLNQTCGQMLSGKGEEMRE